MISIHEHSPEHKGNLWTGCEQLPSGKGSAEHSSENVSQAIQARSGPFIGGPNGRMFGLMSRRTIGGVV